ncbi:hypothetical protein MWU78_14365 [Arenibacter sp. F26102]|uniref:hydrolase n=1 Tax=Arenibacter sp. F26102 TaxID=2926416 RepID=UPI001FF5B096|nr:hydrolase [Arenibacter sp. F26102]MCK0146838.1 hypothetical protein [Arenibacter sp. F26102]
MEQVQNAKIVTEECCPVFHPEKWEHKTFNWIQKKFIKASVPTLFHIPLPPMIGKRVTKMMKLAEDANKLSEHKDETLLLFRDPSAFKTEMYLSVSGIVPNAQNTTLSGTFQSRVFDGPFKDTPKFMKQLEADLAEEGKEVKDFYVHYAYCPKCAKERGQNYMVLFGELAT